jgi:hypothetical protein
MKVCIRMTLAILAAACWGTSANAGIIVNDNFDGYADQAAFQAAWPAIGTVAPQSGELSTAQASSATKSIRSPGTATTGQSRNRLTFAETGTIAVNNTVVWSFDFYDSAPTGSPARNYSNLQDTTGPSGTNQLVAMGFNNNQSGANSGGQFYMARILGYSPAAADPDGGPGETGTLGSGAFFKLNDFSVGARSLGWHNLKVAISTSDGLNTDYRFYVDGILAELVSNVGTAASLRSFDNIALGSGVSNGSTEAFFDNVRLETVPEPATLLLVGLVGVATCGCRRRIA